MPDHQGNQDRKPKKVLIAQLGARRHYAVPRILFEGGLLGHFYTDICATKGWPRILGVVPRRWRPSSVQRLLGRIPKGLPGEKVTAFTRLGWQYARSLRQSESEAETARVCLDFGKMFCDQIIATGIGNADTVYTFNTAGLELLLHAKSLGKMAIMEQTIAPAAIEKRLLSIEAEKHPDWAGRWDVNSYQEKIDREAAEWDTADLIICGSDFVADGIAEAGGPREKCVVVPYGVDSATFSSEVRAAAHEGPLRVLTVGSLGLRKGTPYIIESARNLVGVAEFKLVGPGKVPESVMRDLPPNIEIVGQVPRSEIRTHYSWADVFLLPSLVEGSAMATYEALASGLPVVCTPNTGSLVVANENGYIVDAGTSIPIASILMKLSDSPSGLPGLKTSTLDALAKTSETAYRDRLLKAMSEEIQW